jgi:hypothetical protein
MALATYSISRQFFCRHATKGHAMVCAIKKIVFLSIAILAVSVMGMARGGVDTPTLQLRLTVIEPEICLATKKLKLEAVFSNNADVPISVYKASIYSFVFTKTVVHGTKLKVESWEDRKDIGTGDPALRESSLTVQPHVSMVIPLEYDTSDAFFHEPALFSIRVRYLKLHNGAMPKDAFVGDAESNEVLFQVNECQ